MARPRNGVLFRVAEFVSCATAIVTEHWNRADEEPRNHQFALALVLLVVVLQIAKIVLTIVFAFIRKIKFHNVTGATEDSESPLTFTKDQA